MAYTLMPNVAVAYTVVAYTVVAYTAMAYVVMACIIMTCLLPVELDRVLARHVGEVVQQRAKVDEPPPRL